MSEKGQLDCSHGLLGVLGFDYLRGIGVGFLKNGDRAGFIKNNNDKIFSRLKRGRLNTVYFIYSLYNTQQWVSDKNRHKTTTSYYTSVSRLFWLSGYTFYFNTHFICRVCYICSLVPHFTCYVCSLL